MFRKCTKYIFLLLFALLIIPTLCYSSNTQGNVQLASTTISTTSDEDSSPTPVSSNSAGYVIENYDMNIVVGVDNVFHIQETIDVNFTLKSHGIYRDIPIVNNIKREDGSTTKQVAKVSNLKVNDRYSTSKNNGMFSIKIGDPNKYISGEKSYIISYDYNLGKDNTKKFDELYFNLIGTEWTTTIEKVTFKVQMPKSFDETKLGFSKGYKGSIGYEGVEFSVNENTITGYTTERLYSKQALTIRLELPENYFSEAKRIGIGYLIAGFVVPLLAVVFAYLIFYKAKKHNRCVPAVEFYAPEGCNSLDAAAIFKGKVDNKDVISLLVYLAGKGYIKIEELKESSVSDVRLTKIKDYEQSGTTENKFINALFGGRESLFLSEIRPETFAYLVSEIVKTTNGIAKEKYFEKNNVKLKTLLHIIVLVSLVVPGLIVGTTHTFGIMLVYLFPAIAIFVLLPMAIRGREWFLIVFALVWGGMPLFGVLYQLMSFGIVFVIAGVLGAVCAIFISVYFIPNTQFRTKVGGELYAKIVGFREFIVTSEKDRLESLCYENPTYFYDILPYAYVLGVSDVWIKKFENIAIPTVDWYVGVSTSIITLRSFNSICTRMSRSSTPPRSSSSGGGSSGGGSSGGGSGGGGGGRW